MKQQTIFKICAIFGVAITAPAMATTFPSATTPFSQYGQIQNVQNYSSNPFWNPNAPYNQRPPVPVYAQGPDIDTNDCQSIVSALVASYCASHDNCKDVDVNDARSTITVQLASLPNYNYVTPCAGYIDTEFEHYVSQHSVFTPSSVPVAFPQAQNPGSNIQSGDTAFENPYAPQLPTWNGEPWMQEMLQRRQELQNLQSANGGNNPQLTRAEFPKTANDLTFIQRTQNDAAGYAPYAGKSAYETLNLDAVVAEQNEYIKQMQQRLSTDCNLARVRLSRAEYCAQCPDDLEYCNSAYALNRTQIMEKIAQALKDAKK